MKSDTLRETLLYSIVGTHLTFPKTYAHLITATVPAVQCSPVKVQSSVYSQNLNPQSINLYDTALLCNSRQTLQRVFAESGDAEIMDLRATVCAAETQNAIVRSGTRTNNLQHFLNGLTVVLTPLSFVWLLTSMVLSRLSV